MGAHLAIPGRRSCKVIASLVSTLVLLTACAGESGSGATTYRARTFAGNSTTLTDLHGRVVLLASWASWCTECHEELPALERFWQHHQGQQFTVVSVDVDATGGKRDAISMADKYGLSMPRWWDPENAFQSAFRTVGVPSSVLIGADGARIASWAGALKLDDPAVVHTIESAIAHRSAS